MTGHGDCKSWKLFKVWHLENSVINAVTDFILDFYEVAMSLSKFNYKVQKNKDLTSKSNTAFSTGETVEMG